MQFLKVGTLGAICLGGPGRVFQWWPSGISWGSRHVKDSLRLENVLPRKLTHRAVDGEESFLTK